MVEELDKPNETMKAKFSRSWTFRDPLRTIVFNAGDEPRDAETLAAAQSAGVLEEQDNGDGNENRPSKGSKARGIINLKG